MATVDRSHFQSDGPVAAPVDRSGRGKPDFPGMPSQSNPHIDESVVAGMEKRTDPREYVDENGVVRRRRGRLPGTKARPEWRKPGPQGKKKAANAKVVSSEGFDIPELEFNSGMCGDSVFSDWEDGEVAYCHQMAVVQREACEGPNAIQFLEADDNRSLRQSTDRELCTLGDRRDDPPVAVRDFSNPRSDWRSRLLLLGGPLRVFPRSSESGPPGFLDESPGFSPAVNVAVATLLESEVMTVVEDSKDARLVAVDVEDPPLEETWDPWVLIAGPEIAPTA